MGRAIIESVKDGCTIVAGVDVNASALSTGFPVYEKISDFPGKADVIVDFSHHSALPSLIEYAKATKTPIVLATTGHTDEELALIDESVNEIAIFRSGNFSLGINLLITFIRIGHIIIYLNISRILHVCMHHKQIISLRSKCFREITIVKRCH